MKPNIFQNDQPVDPESAPEPHQSLYADSVVRIERIVSFGHRSPQGFWYDQDEGEWVAVLSGRAILRFESGDSITLNPGDHWFIPAHQRHRVEFTQPQTATIWLAVFVKQKEAS